MDTSVEAFLPQVYVIVGDWCQEQGAALIGGGVGAKPVVSDCEVLTLILANADKREGANNALED